MWINESNVDPLPSFPLKCIRPTFHKPITRVAQHPERLLSGSVESISLDPLLPRILNLHLECAAAEEPINTYNDARGPLGTAWAAPGGATCDVPSMTQAAGGRGKRDVHLAPIFLPRRIMVLVICPRDPAVQCVHK